MPGVTWVKYNCVERFFLALQALEERISDLYGTAVEPFLLGLRETGVLPVKLIEQLVQVLSLLLFVKESTQPSTPLLDRGFPSLVTVSPSVFSILHAH